MPGRYKVVQRARVGRSQPPARDRQRVLVGGLAPGEQLAARPETQRLVEPVGRLVLREHFQREEFHAGFCGAGLEVCHHRPGDSAAPPYRQRADRVNPSSGLPPCEERHAHRRCAHEGHHRQAQVHIVRLIHACDLVRGHVERHIVVGIGLVDQPGPLGERHPVRRGQDKAARRRFILIHSRRITQQGGRVNALPNRVCLD
jgi:hypothetical protein